MKDVERFVITLQPKPPGQDDYGRDARYRLRGLLKAALRRFGLRCVHVEVKSAAKKALPFPAGTPIRSGDGCSPIYTSEPTKARGNRTREG